MVSQQDRQYSLIISIFFFYSLILRAPANLHPANAANSPEPLPRPPQLNKRDASDRPSCSLIPPQCHSRSDLHKGHNTPCNYDTLSLPFTPRTRIKEKTQKDSTRQTCSSGPPQTKGKVGLIWGLLKFDTRCRPLFSLFCRKVAIMLLE